MALAAGLFLSLSNSALAQGAADPAGPRQKQDIQSPPAPHGFSPASPVKEYIYLGDKLLATDRGGGLSGLAAPSGLAASACYGVKVNLIWTDNSASETQFVLERKSPGGAYAVVSNSIAANRTQYLDAGAGLAALTSYTYRIKAVSSTGQESGYSNEALVVTGSAASFTDDPIVAGVTPVKAQHVAELRQAINAMRTCTGLASASWTYPAQAGDWVYAQDVQELRDSLQPTLVALGLSNPTYTDSPLAGGVTIKKAHIEELRQAVR